MNLMTSFGIEMLSSMKKTEKELPDGWKADVRLYFHRKIRFLKISGHPPSDIYWFKQFVRSYDSATRDLKLDLKEYKYIRDCFAHFVALYHQNHKIMMNKIKEEENRARTASISSDS